jgi:hypothetical protein
MASLNLTRDPHMPTYYSVGDYYLYQCDVERPNMTGWILRCDGELLGYFQTVTEARQWLRDRWMA